MKRLLLALIYFFIGLGALHTNKAQAQVAIAFLEVKAPDGRSLQLVKNGRFAHVAISYKGYWLHTDPYRGVEVVSQFDLEKIGVLTTTIVVSDHPEPSDGFVRSIIGTPYERNFTWNSPYFYCSKLVAVFLGLRPIPMEFNPSVWGPAYARLNGQPGISPDEVFSQLIRKGYQEQQIRHSCSSITR